MKPVIESQEAQTVLLNRLLSSAVVLSWDELMPDSTSGLMHIEYQTGGDGSLHFVKFWSSTIWGEWKLVCELWMQSLWAQVAGVRFGSDYHSVNLARTLKAVAAYERPVALIPGLRSLIQVFPPSDVQRREAELLTTVALDSHGSVPADAALVA
jgi:hypothetical protein